MSSATGIGSPEIAAALDADSRDPAAAGPLEALRILVADDTHVSRLFVSRLLERCGHSVQSVPDGKAAILEAAAGRFDLILMDVHMPEMDGLAATQSLRSAGFETPVFALTATLAPEDTSLCLAAGMNACLRKPFDLGEFAAEWRRAQSLRGE